VRRETEAAEARTWGRLCDQRSVACGEQWRIHLRAGVSGQGAGPSEVSWAAKPRWAGAGSVSGLTRKKKRRDEENRKWDSWRMRPRSCLGFETLYYFQTFYNSETNSNSNRI
jgi:hypothetical protein